MAEGKLNCWVYRSPRNEQMYLYLREEESFDLVPAPLLDRFGAPALVMELELHAGRVLAREDVSKVMASLSEQGFHLQMPPEIKPKLYFGE
ncbi:MAG: YcgL domain-containing protein [gamma proteobacterium endosymbiont of Lamellibrachia anaximandri]|nr:YcgL domain-containing protein [gamma proteobacterium endosymbiont of Lamellibrachia anaximandri]